MKATIVVCLFGLAAMASARPGDKYTDKYDHINLDEILSNHRLLVPYLRCILDEGKCTASAKELKSHIAESLEQDCAKCTDAQRRGTERVLKYLINEEPTYWGQLKAKYDPQNRYAPRHEQEFKNKHN